MLHKENRSAASAVSMAASGDNCLVWKPLISEVKLLSLRLAEYGMYFLCQQVKQASALWLLFTGMGNRQRLYYHEL